MSQVRRMPISVRIRSRLFLILRSILILNRNSVSLTVCVSVWIFRLPRLWRLGYGYTTTPSIYLSIMYMKRRDLNTEIGTLNPKL